MCLLETKGSSCKKSQPMTLSIHTYASIGMHSAPPSAPTTAPPTPAAPGVHTNTSSSARMPTGARVTGRLWDSVHSEEGGAPGGEEAASVRATAARDATSDDGGEDMVLESSGLSLKYDAAKRRCRPALTGLLSLDATVLPPPAT